MSAIITITFICFLVTILAMKTLAAITDKRTPFSWHFIFATPLLTPKEYLEEEHRKHKPALLNTIKNFLVSTIVFFTLLWSYQIILSKYDLSLTMKAYLCFPIVWPLTILMGEVGKLFGHLTGHIPPPIHNAPYMGNGLLDFWGKRWNVWVKDWLNHMATRWDNNSVNRKLFLSLSYSGLFHEAMINIPYSIATGRFYFGSMLVYFYIQGLCIIIERKVLRGKMRRSFMWLAIIVPVPFFINKAFLSIFGLVDF